MLNVLADDLYLPVPCMVVLAIMFLIPASQMYVQDRMKAGIKKKFKGFTVTRQIMTSNYRAALVIDDARQTLCIAHRRGFSRVECFIVPYRDVIESEIIEGGHSVTKTSQNGALMGALTGEMLFGRTGALIGGLNAAKTTVTKVTSLEVRIIVDSIETPVHLIKILSGSNTKGGWAYRKAIKQAHEWHGLLSVAVRRGAAAKQIETRSPAKGL